MRGAACDVEAARQFQCVEKKERDCDGPSLGRVERVEHLQVALGVSELRGARTYSSGKHGRTVYCTSLALSTPGPTSLWPTGIGSSRSCSRSAS